MADSLVCADPEHREVERVHRERGQARFQLKERLQRAQVAHLNDSLADSEPIQDDEDEEYDVATDGRLHSGSPRPTHRKIRV